MRLINKIKLLNYKRNISNLIKYEDMKIINQNRVRYLIIYRVYLYHHFFHLNHFFLMRN